MLHRLILDEDYLTLDMNTIDGWMHHNLPLCLVLHERGSIKTYLYIIFKVFKFYFITQY